MDQPYECWGSDRQDFTDMLRRMYDNGELAVFFFDELEERWKFPVTCDDGHKNVFEGNGRP